MKKRTIIYLLIIVVLPGCLGIPVYGEEAISAQDIQLTLTDVGVGNICNNDTLSFTMKLRNPETSGKNFNVSYSITRSDGTVSESKSFIVKVPAKTVKFHPCSTQLYLYDRYQIDVTVSVGSELSVNRSAKFAYVKKSAGIDTMIGMSTQITNGYDDDAKTIPQMEDAGFGIIRDSIRWDRSDNGDGTYTVPAADME